MQRIDLVMKPFRVFFRKHYVAIKATYLRSLGYAVPERYQSTFVHWGGGAEVQYIYRKLAEAVPRRGKILIVGAMGGRDYFLFKNLGYDVVAVDLGPQPDICPIAIADVEEGLPFPDGNFDLVLAGEVLEHLERDTLALRHIRRVFKEDGKLIVSVPYYNDWEEGHMRVHSPVSARRLLRMGGFLVDDYLERPAIIAPNFLNKFQHGLSLLCFLISGRTAYALLTRSIGGFSWRVGHALWLRRARKMSSAFGGYFLCSKAVDRFDHIQLNRMLYTAAADRVNLAAGLRGIPGQPLSMT